MVLGFKEQFKPLILAGTKIHTIREDSKDRWHPGMRIHMATGVRTKKYHCFMQVGVVSVQKVEMAIHSVGRVMVYVHNEVDGTWKELDEEEIRELAYKDGFYSLAEFELWFYPLIQDGDGMRFRGKIIHWTDYRY
jgi:uncharacterized protein YqfB (UPF0267 family)